MAIPSARNGLVFDVDSGGIYFFCQCWHWFLLQCVMLSSLAAAAATMGLVTLGGIALAGGGLVFGRGGNEALFFYARTVSSGDLFVSSSSGSCFVTSSVCGGLVFIVSGNGGDSFCKQRPCALVFDSVGNRSSLAASRTTITWLGSVLVDGGGCFGNNGIARGSGCVTATVHGVCLVAFFINKDTVVK